MATASFGGSPAMGSPLKLSGSLVIAALIAVSLLVMVGEGECRGVASFSGGGTKRVKSDSECFGGCSIDDDYVKRILFYLLLGFLAFVSILIFPCLIMCLISCLINVRRERDEQKLRLAGRLAKKSIAISRPVEDEESKY